MILHALMQQYDALTVEGKIAEPGWCDAKVSFAAELSQNGELIRMYPLMQMEGKKERPQIKKVPEQVKKTSGVAANFLCDNCEYFFGLDTKGKPERAQQCFSAAKVKHHEILDGLDDDAANSILSFFDKWDCSEAINHPILTEYEKTLLAGGNIVFLINGQFAQDVPEIRRRWMQYRENSHNDISIGLCLVSGEKLPIARLHDSIKGIVGAQSSGASLVSYNAPAFESYGFTQGENATVSVNAMLKYTKALNYMLSKREYVQRIGDTTIIFWAEHAAELPQKIVNDSLFDSWDKEEDTISEEDIKGILKSVEKGDKVFFREEELSLDDHFYLLGISPNAARLSVRFFCVSTFDRLLKNIIAHQDRLNIIHPSWDTGKQLSLWGLLNETANQKSTEKKPPSPMAGALLMSIINGTEYPAALLEQIMLRIRAEHALTWKKAAIIKACLLNNRSSNIPKEVLGVELNNNTEYPPYVLGEIFALLEKIQEDSSSGKINTTIRDKYFTSACATPGRIFPLLLSLSAHHQNKLSEAAKVFYDKELCAAMAKLGVKYPSHLQLEEQGAFYLGYYHKRQKLFAKKEEKD